MATFAVAIAFSPKLSTPHLSSSCRQQPAFNSSPYPVLSSAHNRNLSVLHSSKVFAASSISCTSSCSVTTSPEAIINAGEGDWGKWGTHFLKMLFYCCIWASFSFLTSRFLCGAAHAAAAAATDSLKASSFGLKVAAALRGFGWPDEAVVVAVASLPVIELRGAIPVGYWMQLHPLRLTALSVLGNMVPVPFIVLYLKRLAAFLAGKNAAASRFLDMLFVRAKEKAGPVEEFQWLGLMLFVAVPFPGTGAWTGAFIASILDMPFWSAISANLCGVVLAALLVNLLVNLGLKYALITGIILFFLSTFMWTALRSVMQSLKSN